MKKLILFTALLATTFTAMAQVTLKVSDLPKDWEKYVYTRDTTFASSVSIGAAGTNKVWDFSTIFTADASDTVKYSRASDHPDYAKYPGATHASYRSSNKTTTFMRIDSTGAWAYFNNPILNTVAKIHTMSLPMTYGTKTIDSINIKQTIGVDTIPFIDSVRLSINIISTSHVDAWGQLKIPGKTYANVLRMKSWNVQKIKVEIHIKALNMWQAAPGGPQNQTTEPEYAYWAPGEGEPVMNASADSNNNFTGGEYRSATFVGVEGQTISSSLSVYPNPAQNMLTIESATQMQLYIYDASGKEVLTAGRLNIGANTVNIASFDNGLYFYRTINTSGETITGRFVKN